MKNRRREIEITQKDFDSFFMWKVFLKLIRSETLPVFCLKVLACGIGFIGLIFFIFLIGE